MSLSDNTISFANFLKERSSSLLNFYYTGVEHVLVVDIPSSNPYHTLANKFIKQMVESKRLDLDAFKNSIIEPKLLLLMNTVVHNFIQEMSYKRQLIAYIEGLR